MAAPPSTILVPNPLHWLDALARVLEEARGGHVPNKFGPTTTQTVGGPTPEEVEAAEAQIVEQSKRIDFYITEYSIEILAQKMLRDEYVVPSYQREFTWEDRRKSRFIESLIMGLPIPFLFFWERPDGRLEIVDGSQRLRTISEFLHGDLRLSELDPLTHLSGFRFRDLPSSRQRKIKNRSVRGIVLNEHANEAARLDMFERINTGSKNANTTEIRRGALAGPFIDLVMQLADSQRLVALAPVSEKAKKERAYEELVTRFFAYGDGLETYRDRPADFLFEYTKKMNLRFRQQDGLADTYRDRFEYMLDFVEQNFPHGFAKKPASKSTPRVRFEAIAVGTSLAIREDPQLMETDMTENIQAWVTSPEFMEITGADGANAIARLRGRIEFVKNRLLSDASR